MSQITTFIISSLRGGGAEGICVTLANELTRRGHNIDLIVLSLTDSVRQAELSNKVNLINLDLYNARKSVFRIAKYLSYRKPATVLSFNMQISVVLSILRKTMFYNFNLISRNISYISLACSKQKGFWHGIVSINLIKKFYPLSDQIIAQTEMMADDLMKYLKITNDKIVVINNPINLRIEKFSRNHDLTQISKNNYILCVGRLEETKAFHYAVEAFARIASDDKGIRLVFVGKGSLYRFLLEKAKYFGVDQRVDFKGYQNNIIHYYTHANVTLLTSLYEGFPNVLLESIALGTPVVAFDCPSGPEELIKDGVNGFLARYKDIDHLTSCLYRSLKYDWQVESIINTARPYSTQIIGRKYEKVLGLSKK